MFFTEKYYHDHMLAQAIVDVIHHTKSRQSDHFLLGAILVLTFMTLT